MNAIKLKRIGSQIVREVSDILANEANDDLLKTVTITAAEVNNDVSLAKIYFTSTLELDHKQLEKELDEAAPYVRGKLSDRIELRHTPALKFAYDESVAYGQNIENILSNINKD